MKKRLLVTGAGGLIGSECAYQMCDDYDEIFGIDNNMRRTFFGDDGDVLKTIACVLKDVTNFTNFYIDIGDRELINNFFKRYKFDAIIHCAAQPSHDLAAHIPFKDFETNAVGTLNLLESARLYCPESPFIFMSTNKVYGDNPNKIKLKEKTERYVYDDIKYIHGIDETMSIDHCKHSLFGASKVAADIMVQEYGRYFGMPTVCFRGGCLTGSRHASVELHGYLSYIVKCALEGKEYNIFGYKGKQVRDQIHSIDVVSAFKEYIKSPRPGEVYNLGGGLHNSISILETIELIKNISCCELKYKYHDKNRIGDHICYYTNMGKFKRDYPDWKMPKDIKYIISEMVISIKEKRNVES